MPDDDDRLERFLLAVERVRGEQRALGAVERAEIARELGLSEADLAAARERGERYLAQGEGFTRNELWSDALHALEQAEALLPDDLRVVGAMAETHRGRFRVLSDDADRQRVRTLAARCLEIDPRHAPAFEWIREVDAHAAAGRRKRRTRLALGGGAAVLFGAGWIGYSSLPAPPPFDPASGAVSSVVPSTPNPALVGIPPDCGVGITYCTIGANVDVAEGAAADLTLHLVPAKLEVSPAGVKLVIAGRITHHGQTELASLSLTTVLLDAGGAEVGRQPLVAHPSFYPPLRDGESGAFHLSVDVPAAVRAARLEPGKREAEPGAKTYGDVGEYVVTFEPTPPAHLGKIGAVKRSYRSNLLGDKTSIETIVTFENRGETVIRTLEVELRAVDARKKVVDKRQETIVWSHMPPLAPGERRVKKLSLWAPGNPVTETLVVTKVE